MPSCSISPRRRIVEDVDEVLVQRLADVRDIAAVLRLETPLRPILRDDRGGGEHSYEHKGQV